jgi:NAD-dependent dihydropyrimidine dehydrogenase PreA subunit
MTPAPVAPHDRPLSRRAEALGAKEDPIMAYAIAAPCVDHMDACPVAAIDFQDGVDRKLYIDPDGCIDCGACQTACPNSAIFRADRLPTAWTDFAWTDMAWYRDMGAARAVVDSLVPRGPLS